MNSCKEEILQVLEEEGGIWRSNTSWISVKCPFCDHSSSKSHFHLHLDANSPMIFKCFRARCSVSGVLNKKIARKIGINNKRLLDYIDKEFLRHSRYKSSNEYYSNIPDEDYFDDEDYMGLLGYLSDDTEEYFKYRTNMSAREFQYEFRICDSMTYFHKYNKKRIKTDRIDWLIKLESMGKKFIYFFNDRYSFFMYRQINGDMKGKMSLVKAELIYKHKPYLIDNSNKKVEYEIPTIYIAEGVFDIANVYFHLMMRDTGYYIASGGFASTKNIILDIAKYIYMPKVVIMSDSDVGIEVYKKNILPKVTKRISSLDIYYNKKAKDVGDIKEGISLRKYKLK